MPRATYQYLLDTAGTLFETDLISRGLAAMDQDTTDYDITDRVLETSIARGRRSEMDAFGAGTMTLLLDNADKRFSPDYGASPLYPYVRPGTYIKARTAVPDYTSLVSWWTLDETTNSTRYDSHGSNNLTSTGTTSQVTGLMNYAARVGDANWLSVANNATIQAGDFDFSIGCFVKLESNFTNGYVISKDNGVNGQKEWLLEYTSTRFKFTVYTTGGTAASVTANTFGAIAAGTWYFVCGYHDAANNLVGISVNAGTPDTTAHSGGVAAGSSAIVFGAYDTGAFSTDMMSIDNAFYIKRVLSASDLTTFYNSGSGHGYYVNAAGGYKDLFTGFVRRVTPQMDDTQQTCTLECTDLTDRFGMALVTSGLYQSKTTGELIKRLLSEGVSWRIDRTDLDAGQDTVSYAWWTAEVLSDALRGVETSEWGQFFIDGRGYPVFSDRNARGTAAALTGIQLDDDDVASAELAQDIEDIFNEVRIQAHPRVSQGKAVQIWKLRQTLTLTAGTSLGIVAQYSDPITNETVPALNVVTPVATVDYSANTAIDGGTVTSIAAPTTPGTGYDINNPPLVAISGGGGYGAEAIAEVNSSGAVASITVISGGGGYTSAPTVGIAVSPTGGTNASGAIATVNVGTDATSSLSVTAQFANFGEAANITVQNTSGSTIYVPYLRMRGDPLMEPDTAPADRSDGASQANYFKRTIEIDQPWQQSTTLADTLAGTLVNRYAVPQSRVSISLVNWDQYTLSTILGIELDRMIQLSLNRAGIASVNYFVGSLEHRITEGGRLHTLQIGLERSRVDGGGVYDTGIYNTTKYS